MAARFPRNNMRTARRMDGLRIEGGCAPLHKNTVKAALLPAALHSVVFSFFGYFSRNSFIACSRASASRLPV